MFEICCVFFKKKKVWWSICTFKYMSFLGHTLRNLSIFKDWFPLWILNYFIFPKISSNVTLWLARVDWPGLECWWLVGLRLVTLEMLIIRGGHKFAVFAWLPRLELPVCHANSFQVNICSVTNIDHTNISGVYLVAGQGLILPILTTDIYCSELHLAQLFIQLFWL